MQIDFEPLTEKSSTIQFEPLEELDASDIQSALNSVKANASTLINPFGTSTISGGPPLSIPSGALRSTLETTLEEAERPPIELPRFEERPGQTGLESGLKGLANVGAGLAEFISSPAGLAITATGPVGHALGLGWGLATTPEVARQAGEVSVTGTPQQKVEAYGGLGLIGGGTALGAVAGGLRANRTYQLRNLTPAQKVMFSEIEQALKRPLGLEDIDAMAREALSQRVGEVQAPLIPESVPPATPTPEPMGTFRQVQGNVVKPSKPVVPETAPEPERGMTVLQEIRQKEARTKEQIRGIFPQLNREQAAELRRLAWPEDAINQPRPKTEPTVQNITQGITQALAEGDLKAVKKLARNIPDEFTGVSESLFDLDRLNDLAPQTAEALKQVIEQPKGVEPNASQIPSPASVIEREVRPRLGEEAPLRQQGEVAQAQAETPPIETKSPLIEAGATTRSESPPTVAERTLVTGEAATSPPPDISQAKPGVKETQPTPPTPTAKTSVKLVRAYRRGSDIYVEVDASGGRVSPDEVANAFSRPDRSVEAIGFEPNALSVASGVAKFKITVGTPEGPYSNDLAKKAYSDVFGTDQDITGKSVAEKAFPFEERLNKGIQFEKQKAGFEPAKNAPTAKAKEPEIESSVEGLPVVEVPIKELTLSTDVPQFKSGANERGIVEPLGGKFERAGIAPLQAWVRLNGKKEIISGRHRLDLAIRSGEKTVPVQLHYESKGFDARAAARLDAELNIRDEHGSISDYANYFKNSDITEADAKARGLLARAKGKAGFSLARKASEDLFALHQSGKITDAQATVIADSAPGNEGLQALGIRGALTGKSPEEIADLITLASHRADIRHAEKAQGNLFSFDDTAIRDMEAQAALASKERKALREQVQAVKGASRKPEVAAKLGVDVKDPEGVRKKITELENRIEELKRHPELAGKIVSETPFELAKSESVEEQKVRFAKEAAEAKKKADAEKLVALQEKPLIGKVGDIGQGDLLGGGDLFSQSPKKSTGAGPGTPSAAQGAIGGPGLTPATTTTTVLPPKGQDQIIRDLAKGLKLPIRFGRLRTTKFAGYWLPVQKLIGSKKAVDVPTVSHEVGHSLETNFGFTRDPRLTAELDHLGDNTRPGSSSSWTPSKTKQYKYDEGVAEFVRYWLTDPAEARRLGPTMERAFNDMLDANKDVGDTLRTAQEDIRLWRHATDEARLDSHVITGNPNKTPYTMSQLTRDLVDDLHVTRLTMDDAATGTGKPVNVMNDMYVLSRLLRGSFGGAQTFIQKGVVDFKTRAIQLGTSFEDALKPVAGRMKEFRRWIIAKHANELHQKGKETGLNRQEMVDIAARYDSVPEFQDAYRKLEAWQDSLLKYTVDAGLITPQSYGAMKKMWHDYVPFQRLFEVGAGELPAQEGMGTGRGLNLGTPGSLRRQTGSTRPIVDPLETMVQNAYTLITAAEKAYIHQQISFWANKPGMGKWIEHIKSPQEHIKVGLEKIRKQLEDAGADLTNVKDDLMLDFYRIAGKAPWGENIIRTKVGDKVEFYRLNRDLFETFHALDYEEAGKIIRFFSAPAQVMRAGVTTTADFALMNAVRDAFAAPVVSKHWQLPMEATLRGVAALIGNPKLVAEWAASGGKFSVEVNYFDRAKLEKYLREKVSKDLTPAERAMIVVKSPLSALRWFSGTLEEATRIGEYQIALRNYMKQGMPEGEARRMAAFDARDRQDFSKGGAHTKTLRMLTPFWNASLQGTVTFASAIKNRPLKTLASGIAFLTLPKMMEQWVNWNNQDYWDRPDWERLAFFLIPAGKDNNNKSRFIRIPVPFEIGVVFASAPGALMSWIKKHKPQEAKEFANTFAQNTIPNPIPPIAKVAVENFLTGKQGWDMFRNRPVVPDSLADLPEELQWTEQTSLTARKVGKLLGFSPMKVDQIINGTTGGLGKQITHNIIDRAISTMTGEKVSPIGAIPGMRFVTTPAGISSQAVETFYQYNSDVQGDAQAVKKSPGYKRQYPGAQSMFNDAVDHMARLRKQIRRTEDQDEKQRLYLRISEIANRVNTRFETRFKSKPKPQ